MFGAHHAFGRAAGVGVRGRAETHTRKFVVQPLKRGAETCPPIRGEVAHQRREEHATVRFRCGRRRWSIALPNEPSIDTAVAAAKKAARHWREQMQRGEALADRPSWPANEG